MSRRTGGTAIGRRESAPAMPIEPPPDSLTEIRGNEANTTFGSPNTEAAIEMTSNSTTFAILNSTVLFR